MARTVMITDDIDGSSPAEEVIFTWDGVTWSVDLSADNKAKLTEFIETYINAGRPAQATQAAPARQRAPRGTGATGTKRSLTEEDYGFPRRGRTSQEEKDYVKANLDEVNARLKAAGVREIDPTDEKLAERYGL